ncbi:hypothetical protein IIM_02049 [Bacillus cereus VD107]|nr:hypothetical protein IIM_02049 [Bacillus cereus VD107]
MENTLLRVEYLIIIDTKNEFCTNKVSFNNFLMSNSDISIENEILKYKKIHVKYRLHTNRLEKEAQRFFHLEFQFNDILKIEEFEELLRVVRDLLHKTGNKPQILWDDISFYYSNQSYPVIYEVENLMRKLITKFMLTNVGLGWVKENVPNEVKESVKESKEETPDYLYKTDFIQLDNFLFNEYSPLPSKNLLCKLRDIKDLSELTLEELKSFVPKSNWEKYFSQLVECESGYLRKRWERLYKLRNKVAHNRGLTRNDYNEVIKLAEEVSGTLQRAIDSLDKISLSELDKEQVTENVTFGIGGIFADFLYEYTKLESTLIEKLSKTDHSHVLKNHPNLFDSFYKLANEEKNDDMPIQLQQILQFTELKNKIITGGSRHISTVEMEYAFNSLKEFAFIVQDLEF